MKRAFILIVASVLLAVTAGLGYLAFRTRDSQSGTLNGVRLIQAVRTFAEDLQTQGRPVPDSVPAAELVRRGLLTEGDLGDLAGFDFTVSLRVDESRPQEVLARVQLPDGSQVIALADGSVQQRKR